MAKCCEHEYESSCTCCTNECSHKWACNTCDEYVDFYEGTIVSDQTSFAFHCNECIKEGEELLQEQESNYLNGLGI